MPSKINLAEYIGSTGEGYDRDVSKVLMRYMYAMTYQENGLLQCELLHATFDNAGAEGNDASLEN